MRSSEHNRHDLCGTKKTGEEGAHPRFRTGVSRFDVTSSTYPSGAMPPHSLALYVRTDRQAWCRLYVVVAFTCRPEVGLLPQTCRCYRSNTESCHCYDMCRKCRPWTPTAKRRSSLEDPDGLWQTGPGWGQSMHPRRCIMTPNSSLICR
jgi:hypothetical protein